MGIDWVSRFPIDWYNPDNPKELIAGGYKRGGFEAPAIPKLFSLAWLEP